MSGSFLLVVYYLKKKIKQNFQPEVNQIGLFAGFGLLLFFDTLLYYSVHIEHLVHAHINQQLIKLLPAEICPKKLEIKYRKNILINFDNRSIIIHSFLTILSPLKQCQKFAADNIFKFCCCSRC